MVLNPFKYPDLAEIARSGRIHNLEQKLLACVTLMILGYKISYNEEDAEIIKLCRHIIQSQSN